MVQLLPLLWVISAVTANYDFLRTSSCESSTSESVCASGTNCMWCESAAVGASCVSKTDAASLPDSIFSCADAAVGAHAQADDELVGQWVMDNAFTDSTVELFATDVTMWIRHCNKNRQYSVSQRYGSSSDGTVWLNFTVPDAVGSCAADQFVGTNVWAENGFQGLRYLEGAKQTACNTGAMAMGALQVELDVDVHAAAGAANVRRQLLFAPMTGKLLMQEQRSTRQGTMGWTYKRVTPQPVKRAEAAAAKFPALEIPEVLPAVTVTASSPKYKITFDDDWTLDGGGAAKIMLVSLQAFANYDMPSMYIDYGPNWDFTYCAAIAEYYETSRNFEWQTLDDSAAALAALATPAVVSRYVVYDPAVRESIMVAMTLAGIYRALVVDPSLVSMLPTHMELAYDLRGKLTGQTPTQIYRWAYDEFGAKTSRSTLIWMGGECGNLMKPGIADYGIRMNAFFTDLNTRPLSDPKSTPEEFKLADYIMGKQDKYTMVQGWHSYCKDQERTFVTMASSHALRVEGLHTIPNLSFNRLVPVSDGFEFKNNHNVGPAKPAPKPEAGKVYVSCVQTDALGLGAWVEPGRGAIPYAWETTLNFLWLQPAVLEYYYSTSTPNDYFIGALSGPGYMYPKAIPSADLPHILGMANEFVETLDLRVFETMDYSEGSTVKGNTDLTQRVVDTYFKQMPQITGFINGYAPSFTYASKDGRPFVSFDYYLAPPPSAGSRGGGSTDEALADLMELAELNKQSTEGGPYFLLMHVREWSNITRVQDLLARLPADQFETVPLDTFVAMAGQQPTFETHYAPAVL